MTARAMTPNAFIGRTEPPADSELTAALGLARDLWDRLLAELAGECHVDVREWNSYSPKAGWALRLKQKGRNILYLSPCQGSFFVSFALGDRAVKEARWSKLPRRVLKILSEARRYAEGTAFRMDMKKLEDVEVVKKLAAIKIDS